MDPFGSLTVSLSGMIAQKYRLDAIAWNLANAHTTRAPGGGPYRRRDVVIAAWPYGPGELGVKVVGVYRDPRPFRVRYEPGHPDADGQGFVRLPNVNPLEEMANLVAALRAYEANARAFEAAKRMALRALETLR